MVMVLAAPFSHTRVQSLRTYSQSVSRVDVVFVVVGMVVVVVAVVVVSVVAVTVVVVGLMVVVMVGMMVVRVVAVALTAEHFPRLTLLQGVRPQ